MIISRLCSRIASLITFSEMIKLLNSDQRGWLMIKSLLILYGTVAEEIQQPSISIGARVERIVLRAPELFTVYIMKDWRIEAIYRAVLTPWELNWCWCWIVNDGRWWHRRDSQLLCSWWKSCAGDRCRHANGDCTVLESFLVSCRHEDGNALDLQIMTINQRQSIVWFTVGFNRNHFKVLVRRTRSPF